MSVQAFIEHKASRRLRLSIPSKRGEGAFFAETGARLAVWPGVTNVSVNPATAGIVIAHESSADEITSRLRQDLGLDLCTAQEKAGRASGVTGLGDPNRVLAFGLAGLGVAQAARGQFTGSAAENFWNAYRAQTHLGRPWLTLLLGGLGIYQFANGQIFNSATALMFYAFTAQQTAKENSVAPPSS